MELWGLGFAGLLWFWAWEGRKGLCANDSLYHVYSCNIRFSNA